MKKYFRVHLITLIVLQFAAAGLVWLNHICIITTFPSRGYVGKNLDEPGVVQMEYRGLPCAYLEERLERHRSKDRPWLSQSVPPVWNFGALAIDVAIALLILFRLGCACEWVLRLRKRSTP